ncbi:cell division protein [uncultured Cyclobacterium sp.]|uniref:cell division protein FtsQ/DivIB n=1 Tax=uncultured Cyclobacterium sp. TaxID=453820 RepID=UPI0030EB21E3|tara:strand:- start:282661 stop:283428 length:768 start_codon:yes stop_codon:yes gene_type:complete
MIKNKGWKLKKSFLMMVLGVTLVGFIAFTEHKTESRALSELEVYVEGVSDVYFIDEKEVTELLTNAFPSLLSNTAKEKVSIHAVEKKVEAHPFVKKAEVFEDLKGTLMVKVSQHVPIARIVRPMAADGYISSSGKILPTSSNYTTRVLILTGSKAEALLKKNDLSIENAPLMELIRFINSEPFWLAQISALELLANGDINMYQQVGKQVIEFGKPEDIEIKFRKIKTYYKKILPEKGWNTYDRVNVKYKDQIICE